MSGRGAITLADGTQKSLKRAVTWVAALNFAYFWVEFTMARVIESVSLFADSIDFLEDACVNGLVLLALGWRRETRGTVGMVLAALLLIPGLATAWTAWQKFRLPIAPAPLLLTLVGLGALAVNLSCAFMLARLREADGSLSRAAFFSARNDALANVAIIGAGGLTLVWRSGWPDLLVGLGIFALNLDAAHQVYTAARRDQQQIVSHP
jgi:Co/Zn/Cd efflux system component